jgi:hypothetical protein
MISYTQFLDEIDAVRHDNVPTPQIAIDYRKLGPDARLRELVIAVRADEMKHRDVNHGFAAKLDPTKTPGRSLENEPATLPENPEGHKDETRSAPAALSATAP